MFGPLFLKVGSRKDWKANRRTSLILLISLIIRCGEFIDCSTIPPWKDKQSQTLTSPRVRLSFSPTTPFPSISHHVCRTVCPSCDWFYPIDCVVSGDFPPPQSRVCPSRSCWHDLSRKVFFNEPGRLSYHDCLQGLNWHCISVLHSHWEIDLNESGYHSGAWVLLDISGQVNQWEICRDQTSHDCVSLLPFFFPHYLDFNMSWQNLSRGCAGCHHSGNHLIYISSCFHFHWRHFNDLILPFQLMVYGVSLSTSAATLLIALCLTIASVSSVLIMILPKVVRVPFGLFFSNWLIFPDFQPASNQARNSWSKRPETATATKDPRHNCKRHIAFPTIFRQEEGQQQERQG